MIAIDNVIKTYRTKSGPVNALDSVSLEIPKGQYLVIRGPSGSGKTTLLMTLAAMLHPTKGKVTYDGNDIYSSSSAQRADFRAKNVGFIFQMFHLVPYLNVLDNVLLAAGATKKPDALKHAKDLIEKLGLKDRASHKPSELSSGQKQRAAIARAMLNDPQLILADEPTGNLDDESAKVVFDYLEEFHNTGRTVIVVTHSRDPEKFADRTISIRDGKIE